jgi:predicted membrane protein
MLGLGSFASVLGFFDFGEVLVAYWPMIIVLVGLSMIFERSKVVWGGMLMIIGLALQVDVLDILNVSVGSLIWPVILILIGFAWLPRASSSRGMHGRAIPPKGPLAAFFSGVEHQMTEIPSGVTAASATFGGLELDISDANIHDGAVLDLSVMFGAIEVRVPKDCQIEVLGSPMFGGIEDSTKHPESPKSRLTIETHVAFGAVSIKN